MAQCDSSYPNKWHIEWSMTSSHHCRVVIPISCWWAQTKASQLWMAITAWVIWLCMRIGKILARPSVEPRVCLSLALKVVLLRFHPPCPPTPPPPPPAWPPLGQVWDMVEKTTSSGLKRLRFCFTRHDPQSHPDFSRDSPSPPLPRQNETKLT